MRRTLKKIIGLLLTFILVADIFLGNFPFGTDDDVAEAAATYTLTVGSNDLKGEASAIEVQANQYAAGDTVIISFIVNYGYELVDIYDYNNPDVKYTQYIHKVQMPLSNFDSFLMAFNMPAKNVDLQFNFKAKGSYLAFTCDSIYGETNIEPQKGWFFPGDEIKMLSTPYAGYKSGYYVVADYTKEGDIAGYFDFKPVEGDKLTMPEKDIIISTCFYSTKPYTITLATCQNGYLSISPEKDYYYEGDEVTITAHPDAFYKLSKLSGVAEGTQNGNSYTFKMIDKDLNISAEFKKTHVSFTIKAEPVGKGTATYEMDENGNITVTAVPEDGYYLDGWYDEGNPEGGVLSTDNPYTFKLTGDTHLLVVFKEQIYNIYKYEQIFSFMPEMHGTIKVDPESLTAKKGDLITLEGIPETGYELDYFTVGDIINNQTVNARNLTGNTFEMPANDVIVYAEFVKKKFNIKAAPDSAEHGSVSNMAEGISYGDRGYFLAVPNEGYKFKNWTENGVVVGTKEKYNYTVVRDMNLVANFEPEEPENTISLVTYTGDGAVISGVTDGEKKNGELTFTVNSDRACVVCVSTDGGETQTRINPEKINDTTYSFTVDVQSDILISVIYRGDMNLDTRIDSADALLVLRYDVNKAPNLSALQIEAGKVSDDEKVNSADALMILRYDVNKGSIYWE